MELNFKNRRKRIGEILIDAGLMTEPQLQEAMSEARNAGMRLGEYLISADIVSDMDVCKAISSQLRIEMIPDVCELEIPVDLINLVPAEILRKNDMIPVKRDDYNPNLVFLAMADPMDDRARDDFSMASGLMTEVMAAPSASIHRALDRYLGNQESAEIIRRFRMEHGEDSPLTMTQQVAAEDESTEASAIVVLVRDMIAQAVRQKASDIHVEAAENSVRIRFRVDGVMAERTTYDMAMLPAIMARIKIISGMDISEKRKPQDGRATMTVDNREYDIRVSILPTVYGEKCVMRIAEKKALTHDKASLGLSEADMKQFEALLRNTHGMILVTGPTGSGKSTTLYTVLSELSTPEVNIITVEDPVEANVPGVNQVQVNVKAELTFANALRSILRQDPDIIMIGEIRDGETAKIAVQASITGHLVVSTLHTMSAPATMIRLVDMGVESYLLADCVIGVIAQRLVRILCPNCKEEYIASESECRDLGVDPANPPRLFRPQSRATCKCAQCNNTGYIGRTGIYEIMTVTPKLRHYISRGASVEQLKEAAKGEGMRTLSMSAAEKVLKGITSYKEMMRITYEN